VGSRLVGQGNSSGDVCGGLEFAASDAVVGALGIGAVKSGAKPGFVASFRCLQRQWSFRSFHIVDYRDDPSNQDLTVQQSLGTGLQQLPSCSSALRISFTRVSPPPSGCPRSEGSNSR